jgi:paraquat-inducible protein B
VAAVMIIGSRRLFRPRYEYVLFFKGNVNGLRVGAPVKFKGVEVGTVARILLSLDLPQAPQGSLDTGIGPDIKIPVMIELEASRLRSRGAGGVNLADPKFMRRAIDHGLRAQLALESILTGLLYVDLDMHPGTPANLVLPAGAQAQYQEIPTLPTAFEEAQSAAARVVATLDHVDFPKLVASISQTLNAIKDIMSSPEIKQSAGNLNRAVASLDRTAVSIRWWRIG